MVFINAGSRRMRPIWNSWRKLRAGWQTHKFRSSRK